MISPGLTGLGPAYYRRPIAKDAPASFRIFHTGMGKFVPDAYGIARHGIYVRPDSPIGRPEDLASVPIAVGLMAGSHYNVPYRLESYLPLVDIKIEPVGGFGRRLDALLKGEVEA